LEEKQREVKSLEERKLEVESLEEKQGGVESLEEMSCLEKRQRGWEPCKCILNPAGIGK